MKIELALNSILALIISIVLLVTFLKNYRNEKTKNITNWFIIIFFAYAALFIISTAWLFSYLEYNSQDLNITYSLIILVQTLVLVKTVYTLDKDKKTRYLPLLYAIAILSAYLSLNYLPSIILIVSFFLTLILSFKFLQSETHKKVAYTGILYSALSLIAIFLLFFGLGKLLLFSTIINAAFLIFITRLIKDIKNNPTKISRNSIPIEIPRSLLFIRYFIYIIVITNFVLISTIGVHEFSHVALSRYYGCESRAIVFEQGAYPYSEIICSDLSGQTLIALAGPAVPIIIGIILFLIGGKLIRPISLLVIGFNLLASYKDLLEIGTTQTLVLLSSIAGIIFLFIGIVLLAKSRIKESHHSLYRL